MNSIYKERDHNEAPDKNERYQASLEELLDSLGGVVAKELLNKTKRMTDTAVKIKRSCILEEYFNCFGGIAPEETLNIAQQMATTSVANNIFYELRDSTAQDYPEIDLGESYDHLDETTELNDTVGNYSFKVARCPYEVLLCGFIANQYVREEVVNPCYMNELLLLIIFKKNDPLRICLVDREERNLEVRISGICYIDPEGVGSLFDYKKNGSQTQLVQLTPKLPEWPAPVKKRSRWRMG